MLLSRVARRRIFIAGGCAAAGFAIGTRFVKPRVDDEDSLCRPFSSSGFDFAELLLTAKRTALFWDHSTQTQGDLERIREWHQRNGFRGGVVVRDSDGVPTFKDGSGYYMYYEILGSGELTQHVFVRGTADHGDLLADLRASQTPLTLPAGAGHSERTIAVHRGFAEVARALHDDLRPLLDARARVALSGHSMGGAVATLLAAALKAEGFDVDALVTFGAPRLTDGAGGAILADVLDRPTGPRAAPTRELRVVNEGDPFASLPPWWWASPVGAAIACALALAALARAQLASDGPSRALGSTPAASSDADLHDASSYCHFGPQLLFVAPERCEEPGLSTPRFAYLEGEAPTQRYGDGSGFLLGAFVRGLKETGDVNAHRMWAYQSELASCLAPGAVEVRYSTRHARVRSAQ